MTKELTATEAAKLTTLRGPRLDYELARLRRAGKLESVPAIEPVVEPPVAEPVTNDTERDTLLARLDAAGDDWLTVLFTE